MMKSLLILLFATCAFSSFLPKPTLTLPTPQNLLDFLVGNLVSLQVLNNLPDGFPCVTALSSLEKNTDDALELFKNFQFVEGVHLLENTFNNTIQTCGAANAETVRIFQNFLDLVRQPDFLKLALERLANNQLEIIDDLAGGVEKLNNQSFFEAGVLLGKIPHTLLSGPVDSTSITLLDINDLLKGPLADILKKLLDGGKGIDIFSQGEKCLKSLMGLADTLKKIESLVSKGNVLDAISEAEDVLKHGLSSCKLGLMQGTQLFQEFVQSIA